MGHVRESVSFLSSFQGHRRSFLEEYHIFVHASSQAVTHGRNVERSVPTRTQHKKSHTPPNYVVERVIVLSKASGSEELQIEKPVCGGYASAFDFYATLASVLRPTLIRDEVVQVGEPREKRRLAATGMMAALHHAQFPVEGVMGLIA